MRRIGVGIALAGSLVVAGCGGSSSNSNTTTKPATSSAAGGGQSVASVIDGFSGPYSNGKWTNTTFGSTGTAKSNVTVDKAAGTVSMQLTLTGSVFGGSAPAPETFSGKWDASGAHMSGTSPTFGAYTVEVDNAGKLTMNCPAVPGARVKTMAVTGTVTGDKMDLAYTVTFKAGGADAKGTVVITR